MAAAVMTRHSSKPATHKTRASSVIPPRLQLNGAASRDTLHVHTPLSRSCEDCRDRSFTLTGGGGGGGERRQKEKETGVVMRGKGGKEKGEGVVEWGGRERSSRLVVNGVLVESQLSPKTQESICQVFSFDTKTANFEESMSQVWPHRCTFVVKELIETERAYVQALGDIIKGYITPLYGYLLSSGDGPNFIQTVFCNIVKIHRYHLDLLDSIQSLSSRPKKLVQLFLDRDFRLYTDYCTNYSKGNDYLEQALANNTDLQTFIQECQQKLDHSLPLHSHLIKPVQRILKYPLLLEELVKNFDDTHTAYSTAEEACRKMTEVAAHINSSFCKPAKKNSLTPNAIAKIRSKEVEGLQRRRTLNPASSADHQKSPTSAPFLTLGHSKRCSSVEPGDMSTVDRASLRNHRRKGSRKGRGLRRMSVDDLSSSEEDHLARVSDLKSFFENLNKSDTTAVTKSPVVEVGPLEHRQWSVFEDQSRQEEKKKKKHKEQRGGKEDEGRTHVEWPPLRKTGVRLVSPQPSTQAATSRFSSAKGAGKEQSKSKGYVKKKQDS